MKPQFNLVLLPHLHHTCNFELFDNCYTEFQFLSFSIFARIIQGYILNKKMIKLKNFKNLIKIKACFMWMNKI